MNTATIFNIQRYSLHDGGGVRTVIFFKGCPFTCPWCSNPESQSFQKEVMRKEVLCIKCSSSSAFKCTRSPENCPTSALETIGMQYTVQEVINEVKKDLVFYETTEGGVTLSGGEALCQGEFSIELLKGLKKLGINTAIETTGVGNWDTLDKITELLDTVLWDFKIMDKEKSEQILNLNVELMKYNFKKIMNKTVKVVPRIPLIPGYTAKEENIKQIIEYLCNFNINEVHILPFHQYGSSKYKALSREYKLDYLKLLSDKEIDNIISLFNGRGIKTVLGGY